MRGEVSQPFPKGYARKAAAVFLVSLVSLGFAFTFAKSEKASREAAGRLMPVDQVSMYERRFEGIRKSLRPGETVGFVHDGPAGAPEWSYAYTLAQYALAPVVVAGEPGEGRNVGNFHRVVPDTPEMRAMTVERNFGDGIFLLRKGVR